MTGDLDAAPSATSWRGVTAISLAITVVCTLPIMLAGALAVQMRAELQFSVAALGVVVAMYRGTGALVSAGVGWFADRVGPVVSMRIAAGIASAVCVGIATLATSWGMFAFLLGFGSLAYTLGQTGANLLLSRGVPRHRQGVAFGVKQAALPLGSMLAGLAVPAIALTVGWRWAWIGAAVLAVLAACLVPSAQDRRTQADPAATNRTQHATPLVVLAVALFFGVAAATTLTAFTVDAAVTAGISPGAAGLLLAVGSLASIGTRLAAGWMADRRGRGHLAVVARLVLAGAVGYALLGIPNLVGMALGTVLAFGLGWGFNGLFWLAIVQLNERTPGKAVGIVNVGGLLGGLAGPLTFGWIVDGWGYGIAWPSAAVWAATGGLMMLVARRMVMRDATQRSGVHPHGGC